jgi:hypothetical protein
MVKAMFGVCQGISPQAISSVWFTKKVLVNSALSSYKLWMIR